MFWQSDSLDFPASYNVSHEEMSYQSQTHLGPKVSEGWSCRTKYLVALVIILLFIIIGLAVAVAFLSLQLTGSEINMENPCLTSNCVQVAGNILSKMDTTVDPCENFYEFACGGWINQNQVPPTETTWGQFEVLNKKLALQIKEILEETTERSENIFPKSFLLAQEFYDTCVTQDEAERDNTELLATLDRYVGLSDSFNLNNLTTVLATLRHELNGNYIFSLDVDLDEKNTSHYAIYLDQPRFGLPVQYLIGTKDNQLKRNYEIFIQTLWKIIFPTDASRAAAIAIDIVKLETSLAVISTSPEFRKNRTLMYTPMTITDLKILTADELSLNWDSYFKEVFQNVIGEGVKSYNYNTSNLEEDDDYAYDGSVETNKSSRLQPDVRNLTFIVRDINFFKRLGSILDVNYNGRDIGKSNIFPYVDDASEVFGITPTSSKNALISLNYIKWRIILDYGGEVNDQLRNVFYEYAKATQGIRLQSPRWRLCVEKTNSLLGMAVSYRYVEKYFSGKHIQDQAMMLVKDLRKAFQNILKELDWLDTNTRKVALKKAMEMKTFIGFPDWLDDFELLQEYYRGLNYLTYPDSHFFNYLQVARWHYKKHLTNAFQSKNPKEWIVDPTVVNAFYSYKHNSINFPAGILQPPFFRMPIQALNYGAIGSIIGHEITHGFDDTGRQSDSNGNVENWWDSKTLDAYIEKTQCFVEQYENFTVSIGEAVWHVDGNNTLSENIADNGGLRQAFEAYKIYTSRNGVERPLPGLENFTPNQLFFVAFAQVWCGSYTPISLQQQLTMGVHSPNKFRVKGTLQNLHEFYQTWNCNNETKESEVISKTCRIW